jgi:hypothetical protein
MWAMTIIVAAAVVALFFFGGWFLAIPLALLALGAGVALRLSGRIGEAGELRRFRSRAGDAAPDEETLAG